MPCYQNIGYQDVLLYYQNVCYQNVLLPKCSVTEMSCYRNVLWPKCPVTEMSVTKTSITKVSFTEMSGYRVRHGLNHDIKYNSKKSAVLICKRKYMKTIDVPSLKINGSW